MARELRAPASKHRSRSLRIAVCWLAFVLILPLPALSGCSSTARGGKAAQGSDVSRTLDHAIGGGTSARIMKVPGAGGPRIELTAPAANTRVDTAEIVVLGSVEPDGVPLQGVTVRVGSRSIPVTLGPEGRLQQTVSLRPGRNVVRVTAVDSSGNSSEEVLKVFLVESGTLSSRADVGAGPRVAISFPPTGHEVHHRTVNLLGAVSSDTALSKVEIFVNGSLVSAPVNAPSGAGGDAILNETVPLEPGTNILTVIARDTRGRIDQRVRRVTFQVDPERKPSPGLLGPVRRRLAVVIGISDYAHSDEIPPLRYAHRDARDVADLLREKGFDEVHLLVNEQATTRAIRHEIFDFLGGAIEEDLVLIFFAGHGAPDPRNPQNLYLLTYDSDPSAMVSTAFPMWEFEIAIDRKIESERVVLIADACHSGGIGGGPGVRGLARVENASHEYLQAVASARGRVAFTASEARELSQESADWGGGHGVFTFFLLRALRGEADQDADGSVSLGETIDFTRENVRRATRNAQHPDTAGSFDRRLPLVAARQE